VAGRRGETALAAFVRLPFPKPTKRAIAYDEIWLRKSRRGGDWLRPFFALANLCQLGMAGSWLNLVLARHRFSIPKGKVRTTKKAR